MTGPWTEETKEAEKKSRLPQIGITRLNLVGALPIRLILVGLIAVGGYYAYKNYSPEFTEKSEEGIEIVNELDTLLKEMGEIIELPEGVPTLATVTDVEKVRVQDFFKNAQLGDKVLIYTDARKAYLYRPSEKKIIEVGVVNLNDELRPREVAGESTESGEINTTPVPTIFIPTGIPTNIPPATFTPTTTPEE